MSKPKDEEQAGKPAAPVQDKSPPAQEQQNCSGGSCAAKPAGAKGDEVFTVEEIAKTRNVSAPVFAAVMQANNWAAGKKVPVAVFEEAVKGFLGAPMGGRK
jgi:hypothetical protein